MWLGIVLISLLVILAGLYAVLPKGPRDRMAYQDRTRIPKPVAVGESYAAVTGTPGRPKPPPPSWKKAAMPMMRP